MEESTRTHPAGIGGQSGNADPYDPNFSSRNPSAKPSSATRQTHETYEPGKWSGADSYAQARQTVADTGHQAQRAATEWMQQTRAETDAYVRDKPWNAIGIAAGIGFLVGVILRR